MADKAVMAYFRQREIRIETAPYLIISARDSKTRLSLSVSDVCLPFLQIEDQKIRFPGTFRLIFPHLYKFVHINSDLIFSYTIYT